MTLLQARPFRSVTLEPRAAAEVVVKRFHHPRRLAACFDPARARREFAALAALHASGVSVPRPRALVRSAGGWEVHLDAIPGARPLAECLATGAAPGGWHGLLRRLGRLLARLQLAGWEHGDLHPGNVLVDPAGVPWLIDFQRARRSVPDRARFLAEAVDGAAMLREALPARARARALVAWLAALPASLRPALARGDLARALEQRARRRRSEQVRLGLGRWVRESSRARRLELSGVRGWVRRDLGGRTPAEIVARAALVLRGRTDEVHAAWLGAARLAEHGLPAARPALFVPGARWSGRGAWAAFAAPEAGAPSPGALLDALADRGLALTRAALAAAETGLYLLPPRQPEDFLDD